MLAYVNTAGLVVSSTKMAIHMAGCVYSHSISEKINSLGHWKKDNTQMIDNYIL